MIEKDKSVPAAPLRLAVVGAGQIAEIILPQLAARGVQVVSIADVRPDAAAALAKRVELEVKAYTDVAAMLASPDVDAVYIATPPLTHRSLVEDALRAGKHVIGEKPWVMNATEAELLAKFCDSYAGLQVASCASRFLFTPTAALARESVGHASLGALRSLRILTVDRPPDPNRKLPAWKQSAATAGGGVAADWGVYELDWIRGTLGEKFVPVEVRAELDHWGDRAADIECGYTAHIKCAGGLRVQLARRAEVAPGGNRVELRWERAGLDVPFTPGGMESTFYRFDPETKKIEPRKVGDASGDWGRALCGPIENLAAAVAHGGTVVSSPRSQVIVHRVLDAIYESGRSGNAVQLSPLV